jgi:multiple sugar transport system ATP-binding protein
VGGLALSGVSKRFGDTLVLDNISLTIGAAEFVVVLGPSGCGKSTLLRVVAGLESIDAGEILLDGQRIDQLPPGRRGVAMVFQTYALYPHMTARQNMAFGLRNAGMVRDEIARRIVDAARILEMEHLLERRPAELSGGQRQRVAIGRAIVKEPKLFMFDEPLSNLDAALRGRTRQEIANLHRRIRTAMIFVTHDQTEAMSLADRIVVMNARRIEQIGTPLEIYSRPATAFVAGFVGTPAMNFFAAERIASDDAFQRVRLGDGTVIQTRIPETALPERGALRVGLRAEAIQLRAPGSGDTDGAVDFVEFLGDKTHVYMTLASGDKIVTTDGASSQARTGEKIGVKFDQARAHLFDSGDICYHGVS